MAVTTDISSLLESREGYRDGRPCLRGTGITVHAVAAAYLGGASVDDICRANPDLDPGLFYAALAHYFANKSSIEGELESDRRSGELLAAQHPHGITAADLSPAHL